MKSPGPDGWIELIRAILITAPGPVGPGNHEKVAGAALRAGFRAVQLRDKQLEDRVFVEIAGKISRLCGDYGALFFVNDRVEAAAALEGCGVHLGVSDMSVEEARRLLGPGPLIGYSPEDESDAREASRKGADFLGVGPVKRTGTKGDAGEPIGFEGIRKACGWGLAPVVAVGGITVEDVVPLMEAGASGVAVSNGVCGSDDPEAAARRILNEMKNIK